MNLYSRSFFTIIVSVFSVIIGCEEGEKQSEEVAPPDTTPVEQDSFPALGHDSPYYPDSVYYGRENYIVGSVFY